MRWIGYTRVSTDEQATDGHSLVEQEKRLREEVARTPGAVLVDVIVDAGHSGSDLDRPGITEALRMLAADEADGLIAVKLDRVTRSVRDLGDLVEWFDRNDIGLRMLDVGVDSSTAVGKMVLHMMGAAAQMMRDMIAENTKAAIGEGSTPRQRLDAARPSVPDDVCALIRELDAQGLGLSAIARTLTERGIPTARGGKWWASTVASVLHERKPTARKPAALPTVRRARRRKRAA